MASTFTSDTLPADHKAAIRQMKHALRAQLGDVQQIFNQLSDDIATRVAEINALKAQGDAYEEVNHLILLKNPGGKWIKRDLMG